MSHLQEYADALPLRQVAPVAEKPSDCTCVPSYGRNGLIEHLQTCPNYEPWPPEPATVPQYIYDSLLRSYEAERAMRTDSARLISIAQLLEEILAEARRSNSSAREGAVSSVEIKFLAPTKDHPDGKPQPVIKTYAGSVPPVEEAIEAYGRAFLMSQQAAVEGWEQTLDVLQAERKQLDVCGAPCWPGGPPCALAPGHPTEHRQAQPGSAAKAAGQ